MAFVQRKLDRSVQQSRGIFNKYVYETSDTIAEVQAAGYFEESRFKEIDSDSTNGMGWDGGIIECSCSDGYFVGKIDGDTGSVGSELLPPPDTNLFMTKAEYDPNDNGIVTASERIEDQAIAGEDIALGRLLYIQDVPLTPEGLATVGIASAYDSDRGPAFAVATEAATVGQTFKIVQNGIADGVNTSIWQVNDQLFLGGDGFTSQTPPNNYKQAVGVVKDVAVNGQMLVEIGPVSTDGENLEYFQRAGGESFYRSQVDADPLRTITQPIDSSAPIANVLGTLHSSEVVQPDKTTDILNPAFQITPTTNDSIRDFTFEAAEDATNVVVSVSKSGCLLWESVVGDITADVETTFSFTSNGAVPLDLYAGTVYDVRVFTEFGDVTLKGEAGGVPFYAATWYEFTPTPVSIADVPIEEQTLIDASSVAASQNPAGTDTPLRVEFGPAVNGPGDPIEMDATGLFTANSAGTYFFNISLQFGRVGGAGVSELYLYTAINGVNIGASGYARLDDADVTLPTSRKFNVTMAAGDTLEFLLIRDSGGNNSGGLIQGDPTLVGVNNAPTADIAVTRIIGNATTLLSDGDVVGPASSIQDSIPTYANTTGKEIKDASDFTALSGILKRTSAGTTEYQHSNGINRLRLTGTTTQIVAKNSVDNSTTTWTLNDSNGGQFGGSALNVDSASGSIGYKASQNGNFKLQNYWNSVEDLTHISHKGSTSNPNADIILSDSDVNWEFSSNKAMSIDNTGQLDVEGSAIGVTLKNDSGVAQSDWQHNSGTTQFGIAGFTNVAHLNFEGVYANMLGGDAGWSRIEAGGAEVRADGVSGNVLVNDSTFPQGDAFLYPDTDGLSGDKLTTDGSGNLTLESEAYDIITTDTVLNYGEKWAYVDASSNPVELTLGDNPRVGERKRIYIADKTNDITLVSANPAFPINPPPQIGEGNIQGQWTLSSDFLDRYAPTNRDLTNSGTGGVFQAVTVNGNAVNAFNFQQTAYLEATASAYKGVTGSSARSFACWYGANAGQPTVDETIVAWGEDIPPGGLLWEIDFRSSQGYLWVNNRNASRRWNYTTLAPTGLWDGNMHHIAVTQSTANMGSINLYIDGVRIVHDFQDTFPTCNTSANTNFRIGANYTGGTRLNGVLYDCRLFNRALSVTEVNDIINEDITGGVNLTPADDHMVFDVVYNGAEWTLGVGTESLALTNRERLDVIEAEILRKPVDSVDQEIVTYAGTDGSQADNGSNVTCVDGVFTKLGTLTDSMSFVTGGTNGDITFTTPLTEIKQNETTGNIELQDGGGGFSDNFFGRWRLRNGSDSPGILLHDSGDSSLGGVKWDDAGTGYIQTFTGTTGVQNSETRLYSNSYRVSEPTIINSTDLPLSQALQVNEQFSDPGQTNYYQNVPFRVNLLTNNGGSTPAGSATALSLHRSGIPTEAYGNSARFDLSRYENSGTNMRTQLDIRLGHAQPTTTGEDANTPYILRMRSNGEVSCPTTTAGFKPPVVTNAQQNAMADVAGYFVYNSDLDLLTFNDGTQWNALSTTVSVAAKTQQQDNIALSGIFQTIGSGTFDYYEIDGQAATPNFTGGAWVVDVGGTYVFNIRGWAFTGSGSETQTRFYVGVNGNDYVSQPNVGIDAVTKNGSGLTLSGSVRLVAGDVVRIGYSVLSGTGWELDGFSWDVNRVGS